MGCGVDIEAGRMVLGLTVRIDQEVQHSIRVWRSDGETG